MERRQFFNEAAIISTGLLAAGALKTAWAEDTKPEKVRAKWDIQDKVALEKLTTLRNSLYACIKAGQACDAHCLEALSRGETMFASCGAGVAQMLAVCESMAQLASLKSVRLKEMLPACIAACQSCKEACEEHSAHWKHGMHLVCKDCAEACGQVVSDAKKLQASLS